MKEAMDARKPPEGPSSSSRGAAPIVWVAVLGLLVLVAAVAAAWYALRRPRSAPRNVLLVVADTLRADHLGCYGFPIPTSPNIDALAAKSTLFTDYDTVIPATLPSFSSLLTSRYSKDHGASRNGFPLAKSFPLLSEAFRDAGFETAAFVSSYCIGSEFGLARGFDLFDENFDIDTGLPHNKLIRKAESVTDAAISWLKSRDGKKRFFAMVHYFDPHWPYDQPEPFRTRFSPEGADPMTGGIQTVLDMRSYLTGGGKPNALCRTLHGLYCGEIAYMDHHLGRLLDSLKKAGVAGDTLVVITADHGETFWEHPDYFDHGLFVYDTNLRIPLLFHWPAGIPAGREVAAPESNIDLGPTLLDLAGVAPPPSFAGRSFASLVRGGDGRGRELRFAEACKPYEVEKGSPRLNYRKAKMARKGPWKLVLCPFLDDRLELFNLDRDPAETTNLVHNPAYRKTAAFLEERLRRWAEDFEKRGPAEAPPPMDEETRRKLKALGYGGD